MPETTTTTTEYNHEVIADFGSDADDSHGIVYTVGLHAQGKPELFCDAVPIETVEEVCGLMNYLSNSLVTPGQTVTSNGLYMVAVQDHDTVMPLCHKDAKVLRLAPTDPEVYQALRVRFSTPPQC